MQLLNLLYLCGELKFKTMNTKNLDQLHQTGVYIIENLTNNKIYVGSTTMSFLKRFQHHLSLLRANRHKNQYLQNAWNKYGENAFEFSVIEICKKENCLEREQYYMDLYKEDSYNINPLASGTPNMSRETIDKRAATMKRRYANGEIESNFKKGFTPWNKGLIRGETAYLKVPKKKTEKLIQYNKEKSILYRENAPLIDVFDDNNNFLGTWRSSIDLQEDSLKENFILIPYIKSRFKSGRRSKSLHYLATNHINNCANGKINSYKGLIFKYNTAP